MCVYYWRRMRILKDGILMKKLAIILLLAIVLAACSPAPAMTPQPADAGEQQQTNLTGITAVWAGEIAVALVGGGEVSAIELVMEDGAMVFDVDVLYAGTLYEVYLNAQNGDVIRLRSGGSAEARAEEVSPSADEAAPGSAGQIPTQPPVAPPADQAPAQQQGQTGSGSGAGLRPQNPAISLDRAIEIAYADLARRGISAEYRTHSGIDWERGQWVWELEFRSGRDIIEFYINVDTGAIVKFEIDD